MMEPQQRWPVNLRSPGPLLVLVLALSYLPFLNQAFHIDDPLYLAVADNILAKPLFPYDYAAPYEGFVSPDAASHSHLPLTSYYLAFIKLLGNPQAEWVYHLAFFAFPLLAVLAFYDLSGRFVKSPATAACLLLFSPAFLVISHTLSPDVPMLAFWLLALSRFFRIVDTGGRRGDWIVLFAGLLAACFVSLLSLGLILLMAAHCLIGYSLPGGRTLRHVPPRALLLIAGIPLLLWTGWYVRAYLHYDRFVLVNTLLHMDQRSTFSAALIGLKGVSFLLNLGGVMLFPLALWYGLAKKWSLRIFLLIFLLSTLPFFLGSSGAEEWEWPHVALFSLLFSSGLLALWSALAALARVLRHLARTWGLGLLPSPDPDPQPEEAKWWTESLLVFWFFGILAACLILFYSGSVRYSLLILPPVILLWQTRLEDRVQNPWLLRNLGWLTVFLSLSLSLPLAHRDYQFAGLYRTTARELTGEYAEEDRRVWFTGEWGFRYYMNYNGATALNKDEIGAQPGDVLIKPYVALPWVTPYDGQEYLALLEQRPAPPHRLQILDFFSHAGFYSTGWGILPFSFSTSPRWEWFNVFVIKKVYDGPPPVVDRPW